MSTHDASKSPKRHLAAVGLKSLVKDLNSTSSAPVRATGKVVGVRGPVVLARIPHAAIGDVCHIKTHRGIILPAEVISFQDDIINLAPYDDMSGISPGCEVRNTGLSARLQVSDQMIGKVVDALGQPLSHIDEVKSDTGTGLASLSASPPNPLTRLPIDEQMVTGIRSLDALCSIGYGQRIGLFASAGVGKSTLLGMIARSAEVDLSVIALVGERGREVNEFLRDCLGEDGLKKSIVVVATSDESPLRRKMAALTATAIAEHFRNQGKKVLLLVDSLTRTARAIREVSLAAGEVPVRQGYTSSVFSELPRLLERAGNNEHGSITAIYTVLSSPDQDMDPLAEEIKSILDGHIVLDLRIAQNGIRPAIDYTNSISRLHHALQSEESLRASGQVVSILSKLKKDKDILMLGGTPDADLAAALVVEESVKSFLTQRTNEKESLESTRAKLFAVTEKHSATQRQIHDQMNRS